jgi:hypothetical protein
MSWQDYFPHVFVPNLIERKDRFERMNQVLWDYGITANFWDAKKHEKGYFGLVLTMKEIFKFCLEQGYERVIVLEDDCDMLVGAEEFNSVMDKCAEDLKQTNFDLFYMGLQHPQHFTTWQTPNLLRVSKGFSTHALGYSKNAMKFFMAEHIDEPIDNFWVNRFQKYQTSFCSYPMLCSQTEGFSDIGANYISWKPFLEGYFDKYTKEILDKRFKQNT